jgi:hypothetical protein
VKKVKAIPFEAWAGEEDSRSLRLPEFTTFGTRGFNVIHILQNREIVHQVGN